MNWGRKRHMETKRKDGHKQKKERDDIKRRKCWDRKTNREYKEREKSS